MKRLLIAASLALVGLGGVLYYYWRQATELPDWYTAEQPSAADASPSIAVSPSDRALVSSPTTNPSTATPNQSVSPTAAPSAVNQPNRKGQPVNVQLNQAEFNRLVTAELARKAERSQLKEAVKGMNTTIKGDRVESGAVVNLKDIPPNQLPQNERDVVTKLVTTFPELTDRNVYIGLEGKPTVHNGQVELNDDVHVKVGKLRFTPAELSQRLGIPESQIRQYIKLQFKLGNLKVNDIQLAEDGARIQGRAN